MYPKNAQECHCGEDEHRPLAVVIACPPWDAMQKSLLWSVVDWKAMRTPLSKLVPTFDVEHT